MSRPSPHEPPRAASRASSRVFDVRTEERAWRIGADGEEAVAAQITSLGPQWRVLHAVRVGQRDADIDHVVIGPAGVFTVNAKHHPHASVWVRGDTFMVNGRRVPYVRNSRHEAGRASRLLTEHAGFPSTRWASSQGWVRAAASP
ncbi:NERD domain-containing protein [Cellulomonas sp. zg-ZUI222]|nr:NERD domain-containing protein [Cellulomonas sp. zg-ZUI22]MBO0922000.1 NERD domain-containing protein [Cellulomonas wangleii]